MVEIKKIAINELKPYAQNPRKGNIDLIAQSLIEFEAIPFKIESNFDIVFFSSIRSAEFYFEKAAKKSTIIYACIGETTNSKLKKLGIDCEFVGKEAGNPKKQQKNLKIG